MDLGKIRLPKTPKKGELSLPTVKVAIPMAAGILAVFRFGDVFAIVTSAVLIAIAIFLGIKRSGWILCALAAVFGIVTSFVWVKAYAAPLVKLAGRTVRTEIEIVDVDTSFGYYRCIGRGRLDGRTATLSLTGGGALSEGQRIVAVIKLSEADLNRAVYNLRDGILLDGKIISHATVSANGRKLSRALKNARQMFLDMTRYCETEDSLGLSRAILLGDKSELSATLEDSMCVSGVSHYMAVSGTHFTILAAALLEMMPDNRRKAKSALSFAVAIGGIIFFGATKSVLRASIMFFLCGFAGVFRRKTDTLNSLCVSMILITAFRPANILDVGFEMSVLGVFGVGVVGPRIADKITPMLPENSRMLKKLVKALTVSTCAVICTSPLSASVFGGVSACGMVVTLILTPFMTVGMTFLLLSGITGIPVLMIPTDWAMRIAAVIVRFFGRARWLYINMDFSIPWLFPTICALLITIAAFGGISLLKPMLRWTTICTMISLVLAQFMIFTRYEVRFAGNSTTSAAIVMERSSAAIYISGGGADLAYEIVRCLRKHGVVKISTVVAPNASESGAKEIRELAKTINIAEIRTNEETSKRLAGLPVTVGAADIVSVNGVTIGTEPIDDTDADSDIVLYRGSADNPPKTSARVAVYFLPLTAQVPENGVNIRADNDFAVDLSEFIKPLIKAAPHNYCRAVAINLASRAFANFSSDCAKSTQ